MKPALTFVLLVFLCFEVRSKADTIVVRDYSRVFITIDDAGEIAPVTNLQVKKAGFFLNEIPEGTLRVCNENELFIWVDGRLVLSIKGCHLIEPRQLFEFSERDTVFVSLSSLKEFENLKCEEVLFEELRISKEEVAEARQSRNRFREFCITSFIILIGSFALYASSFSGRLNFFINRTFSLKASSYQFINTAFFGRANMFMIFILCFTVSFEIIYIDKMAGLHIIREPATLFGFIVIWLGVSLLMMAFFLAKRILIQIVAGLFKLRKLRDWQLFDLVNFSGYFVLVLFIVILWDFILKDAHESWIHAWFSFYFIAVLLLFELWFIIKFVINSSYRKLLIISYLCATELIPSVLIMVWFFK